MNAAQIKEETLLAMLIASVVDLGGAVESSGLYMTKSEKTYLLVENSLERHYSTVSDCVAPFLARLDRDNRSLDDVIFYPDKHEDVGTTWRFLKIDMSFLRIVLGGNVLTLRDIVERAVILMFSNEAAKRKPDPERN